jgi:hypothetical protein
MSFWGAIWRAKSFITEVGVANAPTLYNIDKDGYITGPSGGRTLYSGWQEDIDK